MFTVVVTLQIKDGEMKEFLPLMIENARTSLAEEPGCHRFDVCTETERPGEVFLYEQYTDRAAFDMHLASAHFQDFDAKSADLVADKAVLTYDRVTS